MEGYQELTSANATYKGQIMNRKKHGLGIYTADNLVKEGLF